MVLTTSRQSCSSVTMKGSRRSISRVPEKTTLKHKRRFCKVEGCTRIVKSQGVCQRHGAKPRKCKIIECTKQAQGNYDGMCKAHFRASRNNQLPSQQEQQHDIKVTPPPSSTTSTTPLLCQPAIVSQGSIVTEESYRQNHNHNHIPSEGEESTIASTSAVTDEDNNGRDLWDESYFHQSSKNNEELAADLFNVLDDTVMTCEEWSDGQMSRKEDVAVVGNRVLAVNSVPSCSDYTPYPVTSFHSYPEFRSPGHSAFMDYYVHQSASTREAV